MRVARKTLLVLLATAPVSTHERGQQQAQKWAEQAERGHGAPVEDEAQPVAGHDAHQAGRVNDARHGAPEPGLADLPNVRVHGAVVEAQAQAHGQGRRVQPQH